MNRFVLTMLAAAAAAAVASAAPIACAAPSPSSVTSSPSFSYSCGGLTFTGFNVALAGSQPVGQVNIGGGSYQDIGGARYVTLNLNPNLTLPPGTPGNAAVQLWYTVSGNNTLPSPSYAINQIGGIMPQSGQFAETVCSTSFGGGTTCGGTTLDQFTVAGPSNAVVWGPNTFSASKAFVYKNISGPSPIHTTALSQTFKLTNLQQTPTGVPEPASMMLIGTGLVGAALFGRRVAKK